MHREDFIYLDYAAASPVDARVFAAMSPYFAEHFGNASSAHRRGQDMAHAVQKARVELAQLLGAQPQDLVFTSGGTEADNLAIFGIMKLHPGQTLICSAVEHHAVLRPAEEWAAQGGSLLVVPVDQDGLINLWALEEALQTRDTALVSVMLANNETGVIQPIPEVASLAHRYGALCHTDAVAAAGHLPIDAAALGVDLLTVSAHKFYGPAGAGALWVRPGVELGPQMVGGAQERGRRAGSLNVPAVVGMGEAARLARLEMQARTAHLRALNERLLAGLKADGGQVTAERAQRCAHIVNVTFDALADETLLLALDLAGVQAASGAACSSGSLAPSHVLLAMGLDKAKARSAVRFSLGQGTTLQQIERLVHEILPQVLSEIRRPEEVLRT